MQNQQLYIRKQAMRTHQECQTSDQHASTIKSQEDEGPSKPKVESDMGQVKSNHTKFDETKMKDQDQTQSKNERKKKDQLFYQLISLQNNEKKSVKL